MSWKDTVLMKEEIARLRRSNSALREALKIALPFLYRGMNNEVDLHEAEKFATAIAVAQSLINTIDGDIYE